jgi:hypothetical protein
MEKPELHLSIDEMIFLSSALMNTIDELQRASKTELLNWRPEAREHLKEMIETGEGLVKKLKAIGVDMSELPEYQQGDEKQFMTGPS